jgi:hypothetical protein
MRASAFVRRLASTPGGRSLGAVHLATSLVASLQLIAAAVAWTYFANVVDGATTAEQTATVVSLSGGALFANVVSVVLLVVETVSFQRR